MSLSAATKSNAKGFLELITCHSFNEKRTQVAVGTPTEIIIYDCSKSSDPNQWVKLHTLTEHAGLVSGIDWNPVTDQIVSCGHDRNAHVWNYDAIENKWSPTLCILHITRAATGVKWAPNGVKFAVTSSSKSVSICFYDESNNWWPSRNVRKHASTIVDCAFSPSSHLIATASTDCGCRIFSIFDKTIDSAISTYDHVFGERQYSFGELLESYKPNMAWVNTVAWSPDGKTVAFATQASTVHFISIDDIKNVQTVTLRGLPLLASYFINDTTYVGVGYDKNPAFFTKNGSTWDFKCFAETESSNAPAASAASASATSLAFAKFQQADFQGTKFGAASKSKSADFTTHKNAITCIVPHAKDSTKFTTSGLDGRIVEWDSKKYI